MIILSEVAQKLERILNGVDNETSRYSNPTSFYFVVETEGFHIDHIAKESKDGNFIPVFISTLGGQYNPVKGLKQADYTIPIVFYFPVSFKDDFFALTEFLVDVFVGQFLDFGDLGKPQHGISGKARCNISIPQFGEIQDLDLTQFAKWVGSTYQKTIEVMEPYLAMQFSLFLSASGADFVYGDNIKIKSLSFAYKGTDILTDEEPIIIDRADIGSSETAPQQSFEETHIKGYPANLGFTKQLPLIIKNNDGYRSLLYICESTKDIQGLVLNIEEEFPFSGEKGPLTINHKYYITNYTRRTTYGQLLGVSFTLADSREEE